MYATLFVPVFAAGDVPPPPPPPPPPVGELAPITLAEARMQLRVEAGPEDALIAAHVRAARRIIERRTRHYCTRAVRSFSFPAFAPRLIVPAWPVHAIQSVQYRDEADVLRTLEPARWRLGELHGMATLRPAPGTEWPKAAALDSAVIVEADCGYATLDDVPDDLKDFARMVVGHLYENREAVVVGTIATEVPAGAEWLLADYLPWWLQ